jgi:small-conductance mechanosensitive channel
LLAVLPAASWSQDESSEANKTQSEESPSDQDAAPVIVDGNQLFMLRGVSSQPAQERAQVVAERIVEAADRKTAGPPMVDVRPGEFGPTIYADGVMITMATQIDAEYEGLEVEFVAELHREAIEKAILAYRASRTEEARVKSIVGALIWTGLFLVFLFVLYGAQRWTVGRLDRSIAGHLDKFEEATKELVRKETIIALIRAAIQLSMAVLFIVSFYYYITFILFEFAETKPFANLLISSVASPIFAIARAIVAQIPSLVALAVIFVVTRYLLRLVHLYFINLEAGTIKIKGFEKQWVWPTYNILKGLIIIFALVLAFPFIPGSDSAAFRGASILLGIMVSLGSNSVVANLLAGLFVIYKRSTNIGDRIQVGEHVGDVVAVKLMETHLKSIKNELISIPNSQLLNSEVKNYTTRIDRRGLLVHTTVGIGYEEPREKIEALLIEAAGRTKGLKQSPEPFVLRTKLGDYAVNYEINAYAPHGKEIVLIHSDLHGHILDVFNENKIQIMTPSYVADPSEPKVAPTGSRLAR